MKKTAKTLFAVLFILLYPFFMISSSYSVHNFYFGFHSFAFIYTRYILIFIIMFILTYLNRNNTRLLTNVVPVLMLLTALGIYIEYFITRHYIYNYAYLLWTGVVFSITNAGVFLGATAFVKKDYDKLYKRFWAAYLVIYLLILYVSFMREPYSLSTSLNTTLGNGTMKYFKAVFKDPSNNLYTSLVCFGNIFILLPLPFILSAAKPLKVPIAAALGVLVPIFLEFYQYYFHCGNSDIDDVVLNYSGYIIGMIIETAIYKKKVI